MNKLPVFLLTCLFFAPGFSTAQNLTSDIQAMKSAYAASGSIVAVDARTIVIEPNMPAPLCAMPRAEGDKTTWTYYTFPLSSITVPLAAVDETLIGEDAVFTDPDEVKTYQPGKAGDATMVVVAGLPGKEFHTLTYDLDKFVHLGPGPHPSTEYGQAPDDTEAFGLTFVDRTDARAFEMALKDAVVHARAQTARP